VQERLALAESFGAIPCHLGEKDVTAFVKAETGGRGVDVAVDAVGNADALDTAIRATRPCGTVSIVGVYMTRCEMNLVLAWYKALRIMGGQANPIRHIDTVLRLLETGQLSPANIVSHRLPLNEAPEAYAMFDRRQATKILLLPQATEMGAT